MSTTLLIMSLIGCVAFAYGWGVASGFAVAKGESRWNDFCRRRHAQQDLETMARFGPQEGCGEDES